MYLEIDVGAKTFFRTNAAKNENFKIPKNFRKKVENFFFVDLETSHRDSGSIFSQDSGVADFDEI